jgi:magnesium-transporting ATPase (P-type)
MTGYSCNLLSSELDVMIISADTELGTRTQIEAGLERMALAKSGDDPNRKGAFAVVIDGETLRFSLDAALKPLFLELATRCETVVCCRVSPAQKAATVKLVCLLKERCDVNVVLNLGNRKLGQRRQGSNDARDWRWCERLLNDHRGQCWR